MDKTKPASIVGHIPSQKDSVLNTISKEGNFIKKRDISQNTYKVQKDTTYLILIFPLLCYRGAFMCGSHYKFQKLFFFHSPKLSNFFHSSFLFYFPLFLSYQTKGNILFYFLLLKTFIHTHTHTHAYCCGKKKKKTGAGSSWATFWG